MPLGIGSRVPSRMMIAMTANGVPNGVPYHHNPGPGSLRARAPAGGRTDALTTRARARARKRKRTAGARSLR